MNRREHLLVCLGEECNEVAKEVSKALRFGLDDVNPNEPAGGDNRTRILKELLDLWAVTEILQDEGFLPPLGISSTDVDRKREKIERFMSISRVNGVLTD